jgi:hypothetical protein
MVSVIATCTASTIFMVHRFDSTLGEQQRASVCGIRSERNDTIFTFPDDFDKIKTPL